MGGFRGQWALSLAIGLLLAVQLLRVMRNGGSGPVLWALALVACAAAVWAHRRHLLCTAVVALALLASTVVIRQSGLRTEGLLSPLTLAETIAGIVLIAVVVRTAPRRTSVTTVTVVFLVTAHAAWLRHGVGWLYSKSNVVGCLLLGVLAVGAALYLRARDVERERVISTAVVDAQRQERIALARELHDIVAHHVTGMLVQAQAALEVSDEDPGVARRLLPGIVHSGTEALGAMRRLVGTLRVGGADDTTTDLRADLLAVVERSRALGLPVSLRADLPPSVPPELGRSVLRVVQEALTNAHRHARNPTAVDVEVSRTPTALRVVVTDDGDDGPRQAGGYGLVGMGERLELLGGRFSVGPLERGWQVLAELPLEVRE
ncbi:sensor histidine kinase [Saccharothrix sp. ALI-22-I]|uniref:sensor histidine kinase n=1 Tax=Saccharothrix sp. ALI-22-I TaxID=1933778 RepID=UPI00117B2561|nr:histidine kinase [Saccharothrix sp. ALI-22-I]